MTSESPRSGEATGEVFVGALLASDLVESTRLIARLGDAKAAELFARHDAIARDLLKRIGGRELNRTDGFLLIFARAIDAVSYAIEYHEQLRVLEHEISASLGARIGIHFGEIILREVPASQAAAGIRPLQPEGLAVSVVARVMSLGTKSQTLLTRIAFDLARRSVVGSESVLSTLHWVSHGPYLFKGVEEPLDIFEVGLAGVAPLAPPEDSEKARRDVAPGDEATLGWRPVAGAEIPHRENWVLDSKLGEGGFGEVWLASNRKTHLKRVFKFCFQADRLRGLKREVVLFRLLSDALGDRDDIAHILDYQFEEPPYFLESEYSVSGSLTSWVESRGGLATIPLSVRLDIVAQVAVALGAAHSAGILHKDVKPSNVLVRTSSAEKVFVQLADFGIGLVTDPELLKNPQITDGVLPATTLSYNDSSRTGTRIYMAPELHEGRTATTKSDIYSLGVLLYQCVIGDFTRTVAPGWERGIADPLLREDIAACVAGVPAARLGTAEELATRLRTLGSRRRARVAGRLVTLGAAAAVVSCALLFVTGRMLAREMALRSDAEIAWRQAQDETSRAQLARRAADEARAGAETARGREAIYRGQAEEVVRFLLFDVREPLREAGKLDVLDRVAQKSLEYFDKIPADDADTTPVLSNRVRAYDVLGEVFRAQGKLDQTEAAIRSAADLCARLAAAEPAEITWVRNDALLRSKLAEIAANRQDFTGSLAQLNNVLKLRNELAGRDPSNPTLQRDLAGTHHRIGRTLGMQGNHRAALDEYQKAASIMDDAAHRNPTDRKLSDELIMRLNLISDHSLDLGDWERANAYADQALHEAERIHLTSGPEDATTSAALAEARIRIGRARARLGRKEESLDSIRAAVESLKALAEADPTNKQMLAQLKNATTELANASWIFGEAEASVELHQRALALATDLAATDPTNDFWSFALAYTNGELAQSLLSLQRPKDAEPHVAASLELLRRLRSTDGSNRSADAALALSLVLAGRVWITVGETERATAAWTEAVDLMTPIIAADPATTGFSDAYVKALLCLDRLDAAQPQVTRLTELKWNDPDFLDLCRQKGIGLSAE